MNGDTVSGIAFGAFGGLFFYPSLQLGLASKTSDGVPGAGFFPFCMAVVVIILGVALCVRGIRAKKTVAYFSLKPEQKENLIPFFITGACILIFLVLWKLTGFLIAAFAVSLMLNWLYKRTLKFNILYTVIFVGLLYFIFNYLLRIQFTI